MEKKLSLQDISERLSVRENVSRKDAETFTRTFFEVIEQGLTEDKFVKIKGFGTFKLVAVGERESIDVNTGERIQINGHSKITFTPDNFLKDLINRPFSHFQTVVLYEDTDLKAMELTEQTIEEADIASSPHAFIEKDSLEEEEYGQISIDENRQSNISLDSAYSQPEDDKSTTEKETDYTVEIEIPKENCHEDLGPEEWGTFPNTKDSSEDTNISISVPHGTLQISTEDMKHETASVPPIEEASASSRPDLSLESLLPSSQTNTTEHQTNTSFSSESLSKQNKKKIHTLNWWKIIALSLLTVILMGASYFAGYFRILCPCELWPDFFEKSTTPSSQPLPTQKSIPSKVILKQNETAPTQKTFPNREELLPKTETDSSNIQKRKIKVSNNQTKTVENKKTKKEIQRKNEKGKYRIVGTRQSYTISRGETIRTIAEYVYGSKGYATYIIQYNNLKNPDNVAAGTVIMLPELERNIP